MSYGYWKPYVPVAKRRAQAEKAVAKANKAGQGMQPVIIDGRTIATTFWGKAWCDNLEAYSDFENRLPRGRAYVRNGSVIDLRIEPGKLVARVMGTRLYKVEIGIAAVSKARWKSLAKQCTGSIASLVELLQGRFSKAVMEHICQPHTGLFPVPKDIRLDCSCPDWATMCKHVAAVLYGVGARLDAQPELLFRLCQVDAGDLVTQAAAFSVKPKKSPSRSKVLDNSLVSDVFGIEMAAADVPAVTKKRTEPRRTKPTLQTAIKPKAPVRAVTRRKAITSEAKNAAGRRSKKTGSSAALKPPSTRRAAKSAIAKNPRGKPRSTLRHSGKESRSPSDAVPILDTAPHNSKRRKR